MLGPERRAFRLHHQRQLQLCLLLPSGGNRLPLPFLNISSRLFAPAQKRRPDVPLGTPFHLECALSCAEPNRDKAPFCGVALRVKPRDRGGLFDCSQTSSLSQAVPVTRTSRLN